MQFTFTLDKITPYISNNKMGNLKKFLKLDEIDVSQDDLSILKREIKREEFSILTNYDNALQHYIKQKFTPHKEDRKSLLKNMIEQELKEVCPGYFKEETAIFAQDFLNEMCQEFKSNQQLIEKKEKLNKLKLINLK